MSAYTYCSIIISIAGILSYLNHRFVRMQPTIAILSSALIISIFLLFFDNLGFPFTHVKIQAFVHAIDFNQLVMNFMLGLLLFAGALTIDLTHLKAHKIEIGLLTIISTIASAFIIAFFAYFILNYLGIAISFIYCMLFGSLISPTDPIAVLALFKELNAPKQLETIVSAEALFNDGVGVVLFITTLSVAFFHASPTFFSVTTLFLQEAIGGCIYGLILGWITFHLLKPLKDSKVEILLTITIVLGGYTLAQALKISGPLAMVVAGIFLANYKSSLHHRTELTHFWELTDELLNTILFLLLGFELLAIDFNKAFIIASLFMIFIVLLTRYVTVALPISCMHLWRKKIPYTISILSWGGLRGGLAVALALSIPDNPMRNAILAMTYAVVLFSILIQGTTIKKLIQAASKISS